ncbi:MAG: UvrD-helicase domain-containing protein [Pseudomonadota bacterium]|nr:UvrD-helicase domain-containing protein [Pseudomonadota bacterium]
MNLDFLNPQQKKAVITTDRPLLVLAGAGSGKTSVITQKIAYLIHERFLPAQSIFAVTFTNKAAKEMKERVVSVLKEIDGDGSTAKKVKVSTFHQLGMRIIRSELERLGLRQGFSILDAQDSMAVVKEIIDDSANEDFAALALRTISQLKNELVSPDEAYALAESVQAAEIARVYGDYQNYLKVCNAVDFDDLIYLPTALLREDETIRLKWQSRCQYLLVDEYQDTNIMQYALVKLLVGEEKPFTVVGDDDQSIYTWRGANPENLTQLKEDFPALDVIMLEQNFRSTGRILRVANAVIANNGHLFEKRLWSAGDVGEPIQLIHAQDERDEVETIAYDLYAHQIKTHTPFSEYAILYRGNHQARLMEMQLRELQVPYRISGGQSFFSKTEVKDILAYLRLLTNPDDDMAFARIINIPRREIGAVTLTKLAHYAKQANVSLFHACSHFALESYLSAKPIRILRQFHEWMLDKQRQVEHVPVECINALIEEISYHQWLLQLTGDNDKAQRRMDNVEQLISSIKLRLNYVDEDEQEAEIEALEGSDDMAQTPSRSLEQVVASLLLQDILANQKEEADTNAVSLMTLHAAKGLEFEQVYIMGNEEGLLPHKNNIESDNIEEERRLFYVGITRAKKQLTLTLARKRRSYGETFITEPSRFLEEIPEDDLLAKGQTGNKQRSAEKNNANFNALLDLLD